LDKTFVLLHEQARKEEEHIQSMRGNIFTHTNREQFLKEFSKMIKETQELVEIDKIS
jgi:hypothetical protein